MGRIATYVGHGDVRIKGKAASIDEVSSLVCAPHSSFLDAGIIFLFDFCPYVVGKKDTSEYPFFGSKAY